MMFSAGHGGQILVSRSSADQVHDALPHATMLRGIGERRLKEMPRPVRIFQLVGDSLPASFPPVRTLDDRPNNLPAQLTSLVGREREVEAVRERLQRPNVRRDRR